MTPTPVRGRMERQLREACAQISQAIRAGRACRTEDLLRSWPDLATDDEAVLELLYAEFAAREEAGECPDPAEWYGRFPGCRERLERLFRLHAALREDDSNPGSDPEIATGRDVPVAGAPTGRMIGRYELIEEIGRGGMGVVYKARQIDLNRPVALKMILAGEYAGERERKRIRLEAEAVARLNHPNIIQVYEVGEHGGLPFLALEFVEGGNLAARSNKRYESPRSAANLVEILARAIDHAHRQGIVHRDLTPPNILIGSDGSPRISDFGLAIFLEGELRPSGTATVVGTPRYMAPEQVAGRAGEVGPWSDIYSLGVILYELLTGRTPFQGATPLEMLRQVIQETPPPLSRFRAGIPIDLQTICLKCLERDPKQRYRSAEALADDLLSFQKGLPILARPATVAEQISKWARRKPTEAGLAAIALLAVSGFVATTVWSNSMLQRRNENLGSALEREQKHVERATALQSLAEQNERVARGRAYDHQITLAERSLADGHADLAQSLLADSMSEAGQPDLRGFEWYYLHRLSHQKVSYLWGRGWAVYALAVSPDGRLLASGDHSGGIVVWNLAERTLIATFDGHRTSIRWLSFAADGRTLMSVADDDGGKNSLKLWDVASARKIASPRGRAGGILTRLLSAPDSVFGGSATSDGRWIAVVDRAGGITLYDHANGTAERRLRDAGAPVNGLALSSDASRLAIVSTDGAVDVWNTVTARIEASFRGKGVSPRPVAFAPGGQVLAVAGHHGFAMLWHLDKGGEQQLLTGPSGWTKAIAISPDGKTLATGGDSKQVMLWDLETGRGRGTYQAELGVVSALAFAPGGASLVIGSEDQRIHIWHWIPPPEPVRIRGHDKETWAIAFAPDGKTLATGGDDNLVRLWDLATGRELATLTGHQGTVSALLYSRDGSRLAAADLAGVVRIWDPVTRQTTAVLRGHTDRIRAVAFSSDGKTLATTGCDHTVRIWNVVSGTEMLKLVGHTDYGRAVTFLANDTVLASGGNDRVINFWDPRTGQRLRSWKAAQQVTAFALAPGGDRLAAAENGPLVEVWNLGSGTQELQLRGHAGGLLASAFSPDGRTLAAAGQDRTVRLWDATTGQELMVLRGHRTQINALAFSPDGRTLASGSHEGAVLLWHAK